MNLKTRDFPLEPGLTHLNHASYGCPTMAAMDRAEAQRRRIERDSAVALGPRLIEELTRQADVVAGFIGAEPGSVALVENTTAAAAALWSSLPWSPRTRVLVLDVEYASVIRGLQVACARVGAEFIVAPVALPVTEDAILGALDAAEPTPTVVVMSAVTSSTAIAMPLAAVAQWCGERGAQLIVDGAHTVGHVPLDVASLGAASVFGSLHKWLPVPRSVGFLWLEPALRDVVRPAEVSLNWDSDHLAHRFGWRGTWDPAAALGLGDALAELGAWESAGDLERATTVANLIAKAMRGLGLSETTGEGGVPPRLRSFLLAGVDLNALRASLDAAGVRAWSGLAADGVTLLRISTHVYNDDGDVGPVIEAVRRVLSRP